MNCNTMVVLDTETTNLPEISVAPLSSQPRIMEFAAIKVDAGTLEEISRTAFLVNPGIPIPSKSTQITGISDADVKGAPSFAACVGKITEFFLGARFLVAHNLPFDRGVLTYELTRIDRVTRFPWPPEQICTVENSQDIAGHYLSLSDLYTHYFGVSPNQTHRGLGDVEILLKVIRAMREEDRL